MDDRRARGLEVARHPEFRRGALDMAGISIGLAAWGLVTGVAMVNSGLGVPLSVLMSLTVFAGSAQLTSLPLIAAGAPVWVVWAAALCVNLRFLIISAQWRPYFHDLPRRRRLAMAYFAADLNFVLFTKRFPKPEPQPGQWAYFWGGMAVNTAAWHASSLLGIALAHQIPPHWGIGFAGTLALLGITYSLLTDRSTWLAAIVAGGAAVAAHALPLKLNILVAIAAAVALGVVLDQARAARAGRA